MRFLATLLLTAFITLSSIAAASAEADFAARVEGYLGYSNLDIGFLDVDAFQGGGAGSLSVVFDQLYLQVDVFGDKMDFERNLEAETVGPGLRVGWRDANRGSAGIVGTYTDLDLGGGSLEIYRLGLEGEVFFERFTIGLNAAFQDTDGDDDANIEALFALYPTEQVRLNFRAGVVAVDDSTPVVTFGLGGEFLISEIMAPFMRWEASVQDDFGDVIQHSIVAGMTLRWGADTPTLQNYDRKYFKPSCGGVVLIGRLC